MARRPAGSRSTLAIRGRVNSDTHEHGEHEGLDIDIESTDVHCTYHNPQPANISNNHMYRFGSATDAHTVHDLPPALSPALHFQTVMQQDYYQAGEEDLLSSYQTSQIAASEDLLDDFWSQVQEDFAFDLQPGIQTNLLEGDLSYGPAWPQHYGTDLYGPAHIYNAIQTGCRYLQDYTFAPETLYSATPTSPKPILPALAVHRHIRPKGHRDIRPALPDTCDTNDGNAVRGRKRALSPDARAAAQRVRLMRACGRCHEKRNKCDTERPCKPCLREKRSLDLPCMLELPQHRWTHLFTEELYGHLDLKDGEVLSKMPKPIAHPSNKPFSLRLHQYFDEPELEVPVIKFMPQDERDVNKSVFPITSDGRDLAVQPTEILSPPLIPAINNANFAQFADKFRWSVRRWLDCAEMHQDIAWHRTFFREEYGKEWPRAVLAHICAFYHQVVGGGCPALKASLQSTVLAYMLGHSFYVPEEDIQAVLERSQVGTNYNVGTNYDGGFIFVSPIYVDRFVKALLCPIFKACVMKSLKCLQDLCSPNKHSKLARDRILATSIVLLIVAGSQQSKAVEKAVALRRRGVDVDPETVHRQISEIEEWIVDVILEIWTYKFSGHVRWANDEPADRSDAYRARLFHLYDKFQQSYRDDRQNFPTEIPKVIDERTFGTNNIDRVLKKFYDCVFVQEGQREPQNPIASTARNI